MPNKFCALISNHKHKLLATVVSRARARGTIQNMEVEYTGRADYEELALPANA